MKRICLIFALALVAGCLSNKSNTTVAVMSFGDLEGRTLRLPAGTTFEMRKGTHTGNPAKLSLAVENALAGTGCDTLLDAVVTAETKQFWLTWLSFGSSTLTVEGKCVRSTDLPKGGAQ